MLDYFILSYSIYHAVLSFMAYRMGPQNTSEYINEFLKCLVNSDDVSEAEAKSILEINLANWFSALVLPYNYAYLHAMILHTK